MSARERIEAIIALVATIALVTAFILVTTGCGSAKAIEQEALKSAAEAAYYAQQLDCVERYNTREDIDKCRDDVKFRWRYADAGTE